MAVAFIYSNEIMLQGTFISFLFSFKIVVTSKNVVCYT